MGIIRFIIRFLISLLLSIGLICLILYLSGNAYLIKAVRSTYLVGETGPTILDQHKFNNRTVKSASHQAWPISKDYNQPQLSKNIVQKLKNWQTTAFLVVKEDSILYEQYWDGFDRKSRSNTFSMAKSLSSLALGAAIKEGCIQSVDQKVGAFLPEFNQGKREDVSIKNLLQMSSGLNFGESYGNPFGYMAKTYYGEEIYSISVEKEMKYPAGEVWKYQGGNTLILSFVIKEACGENLSSLFSEHIWQKIGAGQDALWTISEEGYEKAYCCFYSNARDFARIGQLMLDSGKWKGERLIPLDYYLNSLEAVNLKDESGKLIDYYGYQWWLGEYQGFDFFYARGILGQYILVIPEKDLVMVRLGHKRDPKINAEVPKDLYDYLDAVAQITSP